MDNYRENRLLSKTLKGFIWMFSSKGMQAFFQMVVLIALARLLDPTTFGIVSAALVVITFTGILSTLGIGPSIIQRKDLTKEHIQTGYTTTLILNGLLATVVFMSSSIFAAFFRMEELEIVLQVLSLLFIIKSFGIVAEHLIQKKLKFKLYSIINATSYIVYGGVGVTLAFNDLGVWALVIARISQELFKTMLFIVKMPHSKKLKIGYKEFKELYYYGSGVSTATIFNQIATEGDNIIVGRFLGAEALGLYSRAYQLMVMPAILFGQVMDKVLFPALSKIQNERERIIKWYTIAISIIAILILPISMLFVLLAEEIVLLLFGSQWLGVILPLQILSIGLLFRTSSKISDSLIRAMGAPYRRAWRKAIYAILILITTYIGHFWGIEGVALGVLISIFINFMMMAHLSVKLLEIKMVTVFKVHLRPLILSIVIIVTIYYSKVGLTFLTNSPLLIIMCLGLLFIVIFAILLIIFPRVFLDGNMQDVRHDMIKRLKNTA